MASIVTNLGAGAIFGSALLVSGVWSPAVITSQMRLDNFHMLESFLAASAISAVVVATADSTGIAKASIREPKTIGGFRYDANIIGGLLQGLGMALTGACPGTVLVQIATGVPTGKFVGLGGLTAGILFPIVMPYIQRSSASASPSTQPETVQNKLRVSGSTVLAIYETMCLGMILAATQLFPVASHWLNPVIGGVMIGIAQAASVLLTHRTVGVSGGIGDIASAILSILRGRKPNFFTPSATFAIGVLAGAFALARSGQVPIAAAQSGGVTPALAALGGFFGIFGARLAGGCTSGHGISGMATFSLSSFVTVAAMFGGGIAASAVLR